MAKTQRSEKFTGREKQADIRTSNIIAAKAVADCIRTSLGPKGMDKMIISSKNDVIITNDGATILQKMEVTHPAAKMLVEVSRAQDVEAGDGTTSVVVVTGALLNTALELLNKGIHASVISDAFLKAQQQAVKLLREIAIPVSLDDREGLIKAAITSLNSKVVSASAPLLAPLAVDAVLRIIDSSSATNVDLNDIKVVKKLGGTIDDTRLVDGLVFPHGACHAATGAPSTIENAKIGLIQFCLSAPKANMDHSVIVRDFEQMDRIFKEERNYILKMIKRIVKSGCNVLLIQKSILRDAVVDLSLHYLSKYKIMVVKDIERNEIEYISKTLGVTPVAEPEHFSKESLGVAELVTEVGTPDGRIIKITGVANPGNTVCCLVRGSNRLVIDEAERSVHDALCVVRCLVKEKNLVTGGGVPETQIALRLEEYADKCGGMHGYCIKAFARALEVIPYTLAHNAGLNPIDIVSELRRRHAAGESKVGINVRKGAVADMEAEGVVQPLLVSTSSLTLATECVRMLLKIDDVVAVR